MNPARALLRLSVVVSVLALTSGMTMVAWGYGGGGGGGGYGGGSCSSSPSSTAFQTALPIPPVLQPDTGTTDTYTLPGITMKPASVNILSGLFTTIWGYNSRTPGPTIKATAGHTVTIKQTDGLTDNTSVHLHGGHTPSAVDNTQGSDGGPVAYIAANGGNRTYSYPNNQVAATLWYHDHAKDLTGPHVYKGLAGFYLLTDTVDQKLNLPSGTYDVPLVIQDRDFNSDGSLCYLLDSSALRQGFQGDTILVNGAVQPYFQVSQHKYRLRFLNGSDSARYELSLSTGDSLTQIGSDGGLLTAPVSRTSALMAPAERMEFVIDFGKYPVGTQIILNNKQSWGTRSTQIMRFDVTRTDTDTSSLPATLASITRIDPTKAALTRTWQLSQDRTNTWVINGKAFDPTRIDAQPKLGSTEIWEFQNQSGEYHPIHIHDLQWQIVSEDGSAPPAWDAGWKDTFLVKPWSSVKVISTFADNLGTYVFHCHNLEHEDHAMMGQFQVVQ